MWHQPLPNNHLFWGMMSSYQALPEDGVRRLDHTVHWRPWSTQQRRTLTRPPSRRYLPFVYFNTSLELLFLLLILSFILDCSKSLGVSDASITVMRKQTKPKGGDVSFGIRRRDQEPDRFSNSMFAGLPDGEHYARSHGFAVSIVAKAAFAFRMTLIIIPGQTVGSCEVPFTVRAVSLNDVDSRLELQAH